MEKTTFSSYTQMVKGKIAPYFRNTGLTLDGIQAKHIQSFYLHELKTVSPGTVIHYHANIHKALKYAVKMDLIPFNPADKVERPKKQRYIADYYPDSAGHKADRLAHLSSCRRSCTPM